MSNVRKTDAIRPEAATRRALDALDRKILGALTVDAGTGYAELGQKVGLSAPAVHDRVKKLRASGCVRRTAALLDGPAIGKPLLAFVHVDTAGWCATKELMSIAELPEVEEIHSVTGDTSMLIKVRCASSRALEALLARLYAAPNVKSTKSYITLSTYLERPAQADITEFEE
ncbi:Lrp/AsnC family transcriptional regulator [Pelagibacterium sp. H642]|uniref:Lrp/AsnC family transcriptional regulator n=1 Tax=Pelagibacterium sp. H642 TaxID=1881069 RepID=UPI002815ACFD|nr:Lrp/AsnC family transcriptional regulator [Pelagibacterium sp. H642]WMT92680.1 Lrp/AsnC family transcriptional regulator [Pelagibacterium sp. H642]